MHTPKQAAAWLQQRLVRDETAFRRRTGASDALARLRASSEALVYRKLGGAVLAAPRDAAAVQAFVNRFYRDHRAVFGGSAVPDGSLRVERVRSGERTVAEVRQQVDGTPVDDARWTLVFDRDGYLTRVTGAPFDPARLTVARSPKVDAAQAVAAALEHESLASEDVDASPRLAIQGRGNRLVWTVELAGRRSPALNPVLEVDAHTRAVLARHDGCEHGVAAIPVKHYSHPGGIKDSSGSMVTSNINVDYVESSGPSKTPPNLPDDVFPIRTYSLQRLGSGRSRIWNAKPTGTSSTPVFQRTLSNDEGYFVRSPGSTTNNVFNEQQTYYWAQTLKTAVDLWGREPNEFGHYPVDASRAVNVEIVINGEASMEEVWGSGGVMHGRFRSGAPRSWFAGLGSSPSTAPAVFLFNSAGNSDSPQFFGPEYSSSYSIIAHEVGHFVSWQYGSWSGPAGTNLGSSFSEGHSMVIAALLGKQHFSALEYDESSYVTTGGTTSGRQWTHVPDGTTPTYRHSSLDCDDDADPYLLAWPYVQAMWRLMNNRDTDGSPIWATSAGAIANTAELFMHSLYTYTSDSTMTWDKLCLALLAHLYDLIEDGREQDPLPDSDSYCAVYRVFSAHGLLDECVNSPS